MQFCPPVAHVYNPLTYAWAPYATYLRKYGAPPKRVIFLGMNPGPFGMVQTGVPFGDVAAVRDWLGIQAEIQRPHQEHSRRPVTGFACERSEISGQRLWGLFAERFKTPEAFFSEHIVMNYCPLAFIEESGRNRTPDKLQAAEKSALFAACDAHLSTVMTVLQPEWVIGIGNFARQQAERVISPGKPRIGQILHPSPASPVANRNWAAMATHQLEELGAWPSRERRSQRRP